MTCLYNGPKSVFLHGSFIHAPFLQAGVIYYYTYMLRINMLKGISLAR